MELRILFTGVGRRIELIQAFREAALQQSINLKIYGADMSGTAPALAYCDFTRKVCGMREKDYIAQLISICSDDNIDLLIPTIDTDLLLLSENTEVFLEVGTRVLISRPDKIAICRDKNLTADFFESCGLKAPKTVNDYKLYCGKFPCFIKPKDGSSSINAFKVNEKAELAVYAEKIKDYVIQPFIEGTEYTIDIFCNFDSKPIYIVPRIRLIVRAGEVLKTQITMDKRIIEECESIVHKFKPVGPITVQLIRQKDTEEDYYIEINPRYGGGAPLSMNAGAKSAEVLLKLLSGNNEFKEIGYINDKSIYSRFDQSVCIESGIRKQPIRGVIFDLDDTLYSEKQYVMSGYKAIADYLDDDNGMNKMWNYFLIGMPAIDMYLNEIGKSDKKNICLNIYREHYPNITLYEGVKELFDELKARKIKIGIITDGRPNGQQKKIAALGLEDIVDDIIITDELGGEQFRKPCDIAFRIMQRRWRIPYEHLVYVGDNLNKDFQAPKQLGMRSLYFRNIEGLYFVEKSTNYAKELEEFENYKDIYEYFRM